MQGSVSPNERRKRKTVQKDHLAIAKQLKPLNQAQYECVRAFKEGKHVFAYGSAGTGKSYLACSLALEELFAGSVDKIVIVRSAVSVRNIGFLPGTVSEKEAPLTAPYKSIVNDICGNGAAWEILVKKGLIEFITTSYIRGITIDNAVVIIDEVQNCNWEEIFSTFTRLGPDSRIFVCGDTKQNDLHYSKTDTSGIGNLIKVVNIMCDDFDVVKFFPSDIVRSGFVKAFIIACEDINL